METELDQSFGRLDDSLRHVLKTLAATSLSPEPQAVAEADASELCSTLSELRVRAEGLPPRQRLALADVVSAIAELLDGLLSESRVSGQQARSRSYAENLERVRADIGWVTDSARLMGRVAAE